LEDDAVQYLLLHAPSKREDAVNIFALLEMMTSGDEEIITQARMMDVMMGYVSGEFRAELAQSRLSTPSSGPGGGVVFAGNRFTPRSTGRSSVAFSAMTEEEEEEESRTATSGASGNQQGEENEVLFSTRLEDDELTAETRYDPAQTQFLLTRVNDLSGGLVRTNHRVRRLSVEQMVTSALVERVEGKVEKVQEAAVSDRAGRTAEVADTELRINEVAKLARDSIAGQKVFNSDAAERIERLEEPFRSPTGLPALFSKVSELVTTVNGSMDGHPGAGIDERIARGPARPGGAEARGGSFGLNLGAVSTSSSDTRIRDLEREVSQLRALVAEISASVSRLGNSPSRDAGGLNSTTLEDRLEALEERTQAGTSVTISNIVFNNERDVVAFVAAHVPNPNFGIICDLVILLQTLKVANPTTESTAGLLAQAQKVNMDPLETAIVGSYGVELPTIFDRTQGALTSSNLYPLPSAKTYTDWSNASTGLRDKVNAELKNSVTSARKRIADARMTPTAVMVFRDLVSNSASQWTSLTAFMDQQVSIMIGQYGLMEEEAWALVGKTVRQIFVKMRERRVAGENVVTALTSKREQFASVLWASLQGHALMHEYQRDEYYGHHSLAAITAEHMLKHRVSPKEFASLRDRVATAVTAQEAIGMDLDRCLEKAGLQPLRKKRK